MYLNRLLITLFILCNVSWLFPNAIHGEEPLLPSTSLTQNQPYFQLITTSTSKEWKPAKIETNGSELIWTASAPGMIDQVVSSSAEPIFDLSVPRNSTHVTISISSADGSDPVTQIRMNSLNITEVSLHQLMNLEVLSLSDNQLKELELDQNSKLLELYCHTNQLSSLDISANNFLKTVACFNNQIEQLITENAASLELLSCSNNLLTHLELSSNEKLRSLECDFNRLNWLDIKNTNNTNISKIVTTNNTDLFCIQVDDEEYSAANWTSIDSWTIFSEDCTFSNEAPVATDDLYSTEENTSLTVSSDHGVLMNDVDPDGDLLLCVLVSDVGQGQLEFMPDGSFNYTPPSDFFGITTFTYSVSDGELESNIATVEINVTLVNEPPVGIEDQYSVFDDEELIIEEEEGVLINDHDPDNDPIFASLYLNAENGSVTFEDDGSFVYQPPSNFYGEDYFYYVINDPHDSSDPVKVTVTVLLRSQIQFPNAFTPNDDGLNDTFRPVFKGMERVELRVFDTWGNKVYEESGKELKGWTGQIKGSPGENGNYRYHVIIHPVTGNKKSYEGLFTLLR